MNVSSYGSFENSLASLATNMQSEQFPLQIGVAVLKEIQDAQKMQAQMLVEMINSVSTITADGAGRLVNKAV